ncbi:MAG: chemotaxis protein CheW [Pseudomonadota bacterium]
MAARDNPAAAPQGATDGAERRSRLRQYQVLLLDRMQAARSGQGGGNKELGVQLGQGRCLLDLTQVGEIVPAVGISAVPLTEQWYLGLANVRGSLTGVIDLARYQGEAPSVIGADSRIVTFAPSLAFNCALLVTRVLGLRNLSEMEVDPEALAVQAPSWSEQRFRDRESLGWTRIDLSLLVQETRFLHVGF